MLKNYSIIWDGSESAVREQIKFVQDWTKKNGGRTLSWKDKTIQERVCQYVGNPRTRNERWTRDFKQSLERKYTIVKIDESRIQDLRRHFAKKFEYTTKETRTYAVVNTFDAIKDPKVMDSYYVRESHTVYGNEEEGRAAIESAPLPRTTKRSLSFTPATDRYGFNPGYFLETLTTTHRAVLNPWVVLDEPGLEAAGVAITRQTGSADTAELQARESVLIDAYNHNNDLCGRVRRIWSGDESKYDQSVVAAYRAREQAGRELTAVRRELGKAKRQMTTAAKKNAGITYDLTEFAI